MRVPWLPDSVVARLVCPCCLQKLVGQGQKLVGQSAASQMGAVLREATNDKGIGDAMRTLKLG